MTAPFELTPTCVFTHPLLKSSIPVKSPFLSNGTALSLDSNDDAQFSDPLGASSGTSGFEDPLSISQLATSSSRRSDIRHEKLGNKANDLTVVDALTGQILSNTLEEEHDESHVDLDPIIVGFRSWRELRDEIFRVFNTTETLSLETSFLKAPSAFIPNLTGSGRFDEKKKCLLGENTECMLKFCDLTQTDYLKKLSDLKKILHEKWKEEKRIECILLATEVARGLSSTTVPQFYPAQFVHVTDFLDMFGALVYERLLAKARAERTAAKLEMASLRNSNAINPVDVLEQTRMTARNWFGKIGEIRELIPRLYLECALLRCMRFVDSSAISSNLMRLCELAGLVQHPLIGAYVRCYICRVALRLEPTNRAPGWKCLNDWLQKYHPNTAFFYWPAIQYIVQCVAYGAKTYDDLSPLWAYCKVPEKRSVVLCSMLNGVSHFYLAEYALEACRIVATGGENVTYEEICALGTNLLRAQVAVAYRKPILKAVWKRVLRLASLKAYVRCCDVWMEFVMRYFTINELEIILENLMRKLTPEKKYELHYDSLLSILRKILMSSNIEFAAILNLEIFVHFVDIFREESVRRDAASLVLRALIARHAAGDVRDANLAYQVKDICKQLNDGLNVFSSSEDWLEDTILIQKTLDRFDFSENPEKELAFYVACRGALLNNESLQRYIVERLLALTLRVVRTVRFTTARSVFIQACLANLFITIPSLDDSIDKLRLGTYAAHVALAGLAFLQVEEFVKFSLATLREITPRENFARLRSTFSQLFNLFIVIPIRNIDQPLKYFTRAFEAIKRWDLLAVDRVWILMDCVQFLLVNLQKTNDSNDLENRFQWSHVLLDQEKNDDNLIDYKEERRKFAEALESASNTAMTELAEAFSGALNAPKITPRERAELCMQLAERVAVYSGASTDLLPQALRDLTADAYKYCKCVEGDRVIAKRVKLLKSTT